MINKNTNTVCCFGELLIRFSPLMDGGFIKQESMPAFIGGAELNVATALAKWQIPVNYLTALPDNALASEIKNHLTQKNIGTDFIEICGGRIGTYYLPQGADLKNNAVIYDRAYSSFSTLKKGQINWDAIFKNVSWFHLSAISPALNMDVAAVCLEAVKAASDRGITVSIDLNYRSKLWQYGKDPVEVMPDIIQYCDVVMGNIWAAQKLAGININSSFIQENNTRKNYIEEANSSAEKLMNQYKKCTTVANTFRFDDGHNGIKYYATLHTKSMNKSSSEYKTTNSIDKIGSGDCFMAALILGLVKNNQPQAVIDFAAAAAFTKLHQKGDAFTGTLADVQKNIISHA